MVEILLHDDRPATYDALGALILGTNRVEQRVARLEAIFEGHKAGLSTKQLASAHGLTEHQVRHIISEQSERG